ncbi:MAG TPA: hypothetical protein VF407_22865 [Polyangiaceae bacterium]
MRHRSAWLALASLASVSALFLACGGGDDASSGDDDATGGDASTTDGTILGDGALQGDGAAVCTDPSCPFYVCEDGGSTTVSGTVFMPNGTVTLPNVNVYVPSGTLAPLAHGVGSSCVPCAEAPPGALVSTTTNANGHFTLKVPSTPNAQVVIEIGKWRKVLTLKTAPTACTDTPLGTVDTTLPKSTKDLAGQATSVDLPVIAISTGSTDNLECMIRAIGIADGEFTSGPVTATSPGRVHLFVDTDNSTGPGGGAGTGAASFTPDSGLTNEDSTLQFSESSQHLWDTAGDLVPFDLVALACEGRAIPDNKPQTAVDAMKAYANAGGHVYLSHWHNFFIAGDVSGSSGRTGAWPQVATWVGGFNDVPHGSSAALVDPTVRAWLGTDAGLVPIKDDTSFQTSRAVDAGTEVARFDGVNAGPTVSVPIFHFTTPVEAAASARCGEVAYSDIHSALPNTNSTFPKECLGQITPQDELLMYELFDLARCGK